MSTFVSIFIDPTWNQLYHDAKRLPEHASTTLFARWLDREIFPESKFVVATEKPTREHHDRTRMDITVQTLLLEPAYGEIRSRFLVNTWVFWLTAEGKKAKSGREALRYAEEQAYTKTWNYLHENRTAVSSCWVLTYFGTCARLWSCTYNGPGMLEGFFPYRGDNGESETYLDIKDNESEFHVAWGYIKQNLQPNPTQIYDFWYPATNSAGPSTELSAASASELPMTEIDARPSVINSKDYAYVDVVRTFEDENGLGRRYVVPYGGQHKGILLKDWRNVKICFGSHQADGFFQDDLGIWTLTLEPKAEEKGKSKATSGTSGYKKGRSRK